MKNPFDHALVARQSVPSHEASLEIRSETEVTECEC